MDPRPSLLDNRLVWDGRPGHYEVWYLKLNLPELGRAFWLRYTLLAPARGQGAPCGQLWAVGFDAHDPSRNEAFRETFALGPRTFGHQTPGLLLRLGEAELRQDGCSGSLGDGGREHGLSWDLRFTPDGPSLRHFPRPLYRLPLPRTKLLAPYPSMRLTGFVRWQGKLHRLTAVPGHQAHLWGSEHAERWAWAHCNLFSTGTPALCEALAARVRLGSGVSPDLTLAWLRVDGRTYRFDRPDRWLRQRSQYDLTGWELVAQQAGYRLEARITNRLANVVAVTYRDPDGSTRVCHNSKLADLALELSQRHGGGWVSRHRLDGPGCCAFEVVQRDADPRVPLLLP